MSTRALVLLTIATMVAPFAVAAPTESPVALICLLSGDVSVQLADGAEPQPARLLQRLAVGSTIQVHSGGLAVVAYLDGSRSEVAESSAVTVGPKGLVAASGSVRALDPAPTIATVAPIARREGLAGRPGAVRLRGGTPSATWMYPREGAGVPATHAVLEFRAVLGAKEYAVAVEDRAGNKVFTTTATSSRLAVPATALRPATTYYWRARPLGEQLEGSREEAFVTLSGDDEKAYDKVAASLGLSKEPSLLLVFADVSHSLGMWREACDTLERASQAGAMVADLPQRFNCPALGKP